MNIRERSPPEKIIAIGKLTAAEIDFCVWLFLSEDLSKTILKTANRGEANKISSPIENPSEAYKTDAKLQIKPNKMFFSMF